MFRHGKVGRLASSLVVALLFLLGAPRQSAAQIVQPAPSPPPASQNPLLGSVPTGQASPTPVALSLKDALGRALQYNLGAIEADQDTRAAHAARLRNLNALLPNLSARVTSTVEEINLRTVGFFVSIPGINIPSIVGPFGVADARFIFSQELFNWAAFKSLRASSESEKATQYAYKSDRDLVVLTTVDSYLSSLRMRPRWIRFAPRFLPPKLFSRRPRTNTHPAWSPASMYFAPRWNCRISGSA